MLKMQLPVSFCFGVSSLSFVFDAELAVPSVEVQTNNNKNKNTHTKLPMHKEYAQIQETVKRKQFGVKETG
jgi:hypothetical protein